MISYAMLEHVVGDQHFVSIILTSVVGEDCDDILTALNCREEENLTLDLVKM